MTDRPRVLCVDDEPSVLEGLKRNLRREFDVTLADGSRTALELLSNEEPFAVVVSDLSMPGMNGIELLTTFREQAPDTVRLLLTGHADLDAAMAAVNEGSIFRFLTKPCPPKMFVGAVRAAVNQHHLITAEKVLLQQTLQGSIRALTEVLAMTNPEGFGRATRIKQKASLIAGRIGVDDPWQIEVAAMLSQIGCVVLPEDVALKIYRGESLAESERALADRVPGVADELLANIPRLETVRDALKYQHKRFDGSGPPSDRVRAMKIPLGARVLKALSDLDALESRGLETDEAIRELRSRAGWYDPEVLDALDSSDSPSEEHWELSLAQLRTGMTLAADVKAKSGVLLVARGHVVTPGLIERLRNLHSRVGVEEPLLCAVGASEPPRPDAVM